MYDLHIVCRNRTITESRDSRKGRAQCLAFRVLGSTRRAIFMRIMSTKLYIVRVEDLKPISGERLCEEVTDELVYLVERQADKVRVVDVRVGVGPQFDDSEWVERISNAA